MAGVPIFSSKGQKDGRTVYPHLADIFSL